MKIGGRVKGIFKVEYRGSFTIIFRDEYDIRYYFFNCLLDALGLLNYYSGNITRKKFSITGDIEDYGIVDNKYKITDVRINEKETKILEALNRI